jgi:hypothetical protein
MTRLYWPSFCPALEGLEVAAVVVAAVLAVKAGGLLRGPSSTGYEAEDVQGRWYLRYLQCLLDMHLLVSLSRAVVSVCDSNMMP